MRLPLIFRALFLCLLCSFLSACISLSKDKSADVTIYSPQITVSTKPEWPSVTWPLAISRPIASEMLDSSRIAVRPQPGTLQVYKGAIWSDPLPELVQSTLVQAFEDSGKIAAVGRQNEGVRGNVSLLLDIRQFEAVYDDRNQPPSVVIAIQAKLFGNPGGRVLAAKTFRFTIPAHEEKIPAVMRAFDTAIAQMTTDIVGWTLTNGQANPPQLEPKH